MLPLQRRITDGLARRSAAGETGCREELVELLKQELLTSGARFRVMSVTGDGSTAFDPMAATTQLLVKLMSENAPADLRSEVTARIAEALQDLMSANLAESPSDDIPSMGRRILLSPMAAGGARREVSIEELHAALERMDQLKGNSSELTMMCLVFGLSVGDAARAVQRPAEVVQLEWTLSREWMVRELDLVSKSSPS